MKKNNHHSMWSAILWGLMVSILFSILGAAIGASIINSGGVREEASSWLTAVVWGISTFCGIMLALSLFKEKPMISASITAGGYLLVLTVVHLLLCEQQFIGYGKGIIAILIATIIAILLNLKKPKTKRRKSGYRSR